MSRRAFAALLVAFAVAAPAQAETRASRSVSHDPPAATTPATTTTPAPPATTQPATPPTAYTDPLSALGAASPTCRSEVSAVGRRNCASSGAVEHRYPLSSYGFDVQVGFSITRMQDSFLGALQSIAALLWMALVYLVKAVMLLLEWAFSLDLLGEAMTSVRETLHTLHDRVIGQPWFIAALSVVALWGIWHGMVQRRTTQTLGALAATVGLMICALVVLARPDDTVGYASHLANDASIGILAAATTADVENPRRALSDAMIGVFDTTVRDPWCALQFGSVDYCHEHAKGSSRLTNADVWLAFPAGSGERKALYKLLKGEDPDDGGGGLLSFATKPLLGLVGLGGGKQVTVPDQVKALVEKAPERAEMQQAGGTFPRFALLALIAVGMTGTVALLAYLGVRLLLAAILALLLLLFTPAMLLAPAFGESGRATFVAWAKRLVGALAAKLIYALFLAVVLAGAAALRDLQVGWFATWLLQIAFWWGVLIKRHELIGFVSAGAPGEHRTGAGSMLSKAYYAAQLGRTARTAVRHAAQHPRVGAARVAQARQERRTARTAATAAIASEQLDAGAAASIGQRQQQAARTVARRDSDQREIRALDRHLAGHDEARAAARAQGLPEPTANQQQAAMLARRRALQERLADPALRAAEQIRLRAERAEAESGDPVGARDVQSHRDRRARELRHDLPTDDPRHLRAAGIDPAVYAHSTDGEREQLRQQVAAVVARERELHAAVEGRPSELRVDPRELRRRSAEERERLRRERRARQTRANVFRGR